MLWCIVCSLSQITHSVSCVQLSYGLSSEYSKSPAAEKTDSEKVDADRQLYAKYYVSQIMQMGEEGIRDAWSKAITNSLLCSVQLSEHLVQVAHPSG